MSRFKHQFLNQLPSKLEPNTLYVSMEYGTVIHLCACGCGRKVVTPLSPTDWKLTFDGSALTLSPSIGNWQYPCRSHYWIRGSRIEWAFDSGRPANARKQLLDDPWDLSDCPGERRVEGTSQNGDQDASFWRRLQKRWRQ